MFVFLDESIRTHRRTGASFGVLAGLCVSDRAVRSLQASIYAVRRPYDGVVLREDQELKGQELLGGATFKSMAMRGFSDQ